MRKVKEVKAELLEELSRLEMDKEESRCQAELIIEHATGLTVTEQVLRENEDVDWHCSEVIADLLRRRKAHEPLQYCLGYAYFMGLKFTMKQGVFIPRSDTETLAYLAISHLKQVTNPLVCEIGSGSGALAIAILKAVPMAEVVAIDSSSKAALLTQENAKDKGVLSRLEVVVDDWQKALPFGLDAIVSNPPYIPWRSYNSLSLEITAWEPKEALFGTDEDGLGFYRAFALKGISHLKPGGKVLIEVGDGQSEAVRAIFNEGGLEDVFVHNDLNGLPRVVCAGRCKAGL